MKKIRLIQYIHFPNQVYGEAKASLAMVNVHTWHNKFIVLIFSCKIVFSCFVESPYFAKYAKLLPQYSSQTNNCWPISLSSLCWIHNVRDFVAWTNKILVLQEILLKVLNTHIKAYKPFFAICNNQSSHTFSKL